MSFFIPPTARSVRIKTDMSKEFAMATGQVVEDKIWNRDTSTLDCFDNDWNCRWRSLKTERERERARQQQSVEAVHLTIGEE